VRAARAERLIDKPMRPFVVPTEFATTDRILQRWAVSIGTGVQSDQWQDMPPRSRPPPLDDHSAIIMDQIVMRSQPKTKAIIFKLYRTDLPNSAIASMLNLTESTLQVAWEMSLLFTQKRILDSNDPALLEMLRFRDA
jgi:hypothetical protein